MNENQLFTKCSVHYDHKMPLDRMSHEKTKKSSLLKIINFKSAGFKFSAFCIRTSESISGKARQVAKDRKSEVTEIL